MGALCYNTLRHSAQVDRVCDNHCLYLDELNVGFNIHARGYAVYLSCSI